MIDLDMLYDTLNEQEAVNEGVGEAVTPIDPLLLRDNDEKVGEADSVAVIVHDCEAVFVKVGANVSDGVFVKVTLGVFDDDLLGEALENEGL